MKSAKIVKFSVLGFALVFLAAAIIIFPERYIQSCFQGFALWAECVLPSLFPFIVISLIFIKTGIADKAALPLKKVTSLFGLPPAAAICFLISICSGYPAGSRVVAEFYEQGSITSSDAKKLSVLCSTSGPLFIIGSIGVKMLDDKFTGWKILIAHAISIISVSLVIALITKKKSAQTFSKRNPSGNALYDSFYGAITAVLNAGAFIAFFCVAAQIAYDFNLLLPLEKLLSLFMTEDGAAAVCRGILEATSGCRALADSDDKLKIALSGFLITFGGASILLQQLSYLINAKVKPTYFIGVKFLQALMCFFILLIWS